MRCGLLDFALVINTAGTRPLLLSGEHAAGGTVKDIGGAYLAGTTWNSLAEQLSELAEEHSRVKTALDMAGTAVEWQEIELYATTRGRTKQTVVGIPSEAFWRSWRRLRADYKAAGISLRKSEAGWEVVLWVPGSVGCNPF